MEGMERHGMSKKLGCGGRGYRCEEELIASLFQMEQNQAERPTKEQNHKSCYKKPTIYEDGK